MPKYIELSEDESWAIDLMVRHTYAESGSVIGQGLLLKVMNLIVVVPRHHQWPCRWRLLRRSAGRLIIRFGAT